MIGLAVGRQRSVFNDLKIRGTWTKSMLQNGLWLPGHPPQNLFLNFFNEKSVSWRDYLVRGYRPIVWTLFGDEDGSKLGELTKIFPMYDGCLHSLKFLYGNTPPAQSETEYLRSLDLAQIAELPYSSCNVEEFDIDGPGGERISEIREATYRASDGADRLCYNVCPSRICAPVL